jgi:hypothetical protein
MRAGENGRWCMRKQGVELGVGRSALGQCLFVRGRNKWTSLLWY